MGVTVGSIGVLVSLGAVVLCRSCVLLGFIVPPMPVMVLCLPMVMCGSLVMARRRMMMFGSRMSCGCGHVHPPAKI
jgi:hypothetical protein